MSSVSVSVAPKGKSKHAKPKSEKVLVVSQKVSVQKKLNSSLNSAQRQLWRAFMDPFDEVPPTVSPNDLLAFRATVYDRRLVTLNTGGCAFFQAYPSLSSASTAMSAISYATPITANAGNTWQTANTTYTSFTGAGTILAAGNYLMPVCGGIRLIPTGVLTASSGIAFGGVEPPLVAGTNIFSFCTPNNTLSTPYSLEVVPLANGVTALYHSSRTEMYYGNQSAMIGSGTYPGAIVPGPYVGILGGQNTQTFLVESIFHHQLTVSSDAICLFPGQEDGMTMEDYEIVCRIFAKKVPRSVLQTAKATLGTSVLNRVRSHGHGRGHGGSSSASSGVAGQQVPVHVLRSVMSCVK